MWLKYSRAPIMNGEQWDRTQEEPDSCYGKPKGFWISDDTEYCWRQWCIDNQFEFESLTHKHQVELDESDILFLRSAADIRRFTHRYRFAFSWGDGGRYVDLCIDWRKVADQYSGIIITPYQWSCRLGDGTRWYYTWDCASGCIWRASAIKAIRLIEIDREIAKKPSAVDRLKERFAELDI